VSAMADHGVPMEVADSLLNHAAAQTRGGIAGVDKLSDPDKDACLAEMLAAVQFVADGGRDLWMRVLFAAKASGAPPFPM
jgi:hypothetical protein